MSKNTREEIFKVFKLFDEDNVGKIFFRNLKKISMELGEGLTDEELQEMIDEADRGAQTTLETSEDGMLTDGDGAINFEEFYRVMRKRGDNPLDEISDDE